jgi:ABC-2 type transport system permease protein
MERDAGTLKRLRGTPMSPASYFIGKSILVLFSMLAQVILLMGIGIALFGLKAPSSAGKWLDFILFLLIGTICSTALGIAFSAIPKSGRGASAVVSPIVIILQFFSGVFFIFTQLPSWMQHFAAIFPLKWLTQSMRSVFLPDSFVTQEAAKSWEYSRSLLILIVWTVIGVFFSIKKFKWSNS